MTDITAMAAGSTKRPFDPGISSEGESLWSKTLQDTFKQREVIGLFTHKLNGWHYIDRVNDKLDKAVIKNIATPIAQKL